jgi:GAF domain-containing protein
LSEAEEKLIHIPYIFEGGKILSIDPFPLGEGLTSILISTKQPLMLVENTEQQARELGAKVLGLMPKSWLGVPLVHKGEVLGAIIIQDLYSEHRFNENHMRLLVTASAPIAAAIRNTQLLHQFSDQTARERQLHEVTRKIRTSLDANTILGVAATELGKTLGLHRVKIAVSGSILTSDGKSSNGHQDQKDECLSQGEGAADEAV